MNFVGVMKFLGTRERFCTEGSEHGPELLELKVWASLSDRGFGRSCVKPEVGFGDPWGSRYPTPDIL